MRCVLGVDPGLAHFGWVVLAVADDGPALPIAMGVLAQPPRKGELHGPGTVRRTIALAHFVQDLFRKYRFALVAVEAMSFPRSASAAAKMMASRAVLIAECARRNLVILEQSPQTVKREIGGRPDASKTRVERRLVRYYGPRIIEPLVSGIAKGKREHPFDGLAVATSVLRSDEGKAALERKA